MPERLKFLPYLRGRLGAISFITIGELLFGAYRRSWGAARISAMEQHIKENYVVVPYSIDVARIWGRLVASCQDGGFTPGPNDAWIAASAVAFECPVVTNDGAFQEMSRHYPDLAVLP